MRLRTFEAFNTRLEGGDRSLLFSSTMFTHTSGSNYYFPQYAEFSDAQQTPSAVASTTSNPAINGEINDTTSMATVIPIMPPQTGLEMEEEEPHYYSEYSASVSDPQPPIYSNYVHYDSPLPTYMWPQVTDQTSWEGVPADIPHPDLIYPDTRYSEQQQQQQQHAETHQQRHSHQHQNPFEGMAPGVGATDVPPVPIVCGGFAQPKIAEYQLDGSMKPPFSYITLIVSAMMSNKEKRATLSEIYAWIMNHFVYYRKNTKRWQNSVRHALSFNDCFTKVPRPPGETGKGAYWTLHEGATGMFENGSSIRRCRKFVDEQRVRPRSGRSRRKKTQEKDSRVLPPAASGASHFQPTRQLHESQPPLPPHPPPPPPPPPLALPLPSHIEAADRGVNPSNGQRESYIMGI